MRYRWDVDDKTVVAVTTGAFSKVEVEIDGAKVESALKLQRTSSQNFPLSGGRTAEIKVTPVVMGAPTIELRVDGQLMVPTGSEPITCPSCGAVTPPNDRFCAACGQAMPAPETYMLAKRTREATVAIWTLAVLFAIFGVIMFFVTKSQTADVLDKLAAADPNYSQTIDGTVYTVREVRDQLAWAPWNVLMVNAILSVVMVGLAIWSRRAPLAAIVIAAATYATVQVANAIIDPTTIAQGIIVKIIVIAALLRGIQSALKQRSASSAAAAANG